MSDDETTDSQWETESDGSETSATERPIIVPRLLPIPKHLAYPGTQLCDVCSALKLTPKHFVVLPGDKEVANKPDDPNIHLGLVDDIKKKACPFCRLVIKALGEAEVPSVEDAEPVEVVLSWNTDGPKFDPNQPWMHTPQVRVLKPYARTTKGDYVRSKRLNMFPEISLLANDSPITPTTFLPRLIDQSKIDFAMIRNWIMLCKFHHGEQCGKAKMQEHEVKHPSDEIPGFYLIDVFKNCLVQDTGRCEFVTLSYVWGKVEVFRTLKRNVSTLKQPGSLKLPEFQSQIPWTIRDAMQVTKEIGFHYLWVDSLCIVQDDNIEEMNKTISKMDLVYGAAFLTITAASGKHANSGLPGVRPGTRSFRQPVESIAPDFRLAFKPRSVDYLGECVYYTRAWT